MTASHQPAAASVLLLAQPASGGVARHVADLAQGLAARGWRVAVGCPQGAGLAERLRIAGLEVHPVPFVRAIDPVGDARALLATRRLIKRVAPDLIHAHSSKAGFLGRAAARSLGRVPTVYTPHCLAFTGIERSARGRVYRLAERIAGPWTSALIAVADAEARQAIAAGLLPAARVRRVYNGIAAGAVGPADGDEHRASRPGDTVTFVTVGRADRQKAFDVFVEAALLAGSDAPAARFVVVGGDYTRQGELDRLRARIREAGAEGVVDLLGENPHPDDVLARADSLVLPSRWEAFPYVILEAARHALPVVATPVGGVPEIVEDGVTGLLVPVDNAGALAQAMVRLARDEDARRRMGRAMADRAAVFTVERMVDETEAVYRVLLGIAKGAEIAS